MGFAQREQFFARHLAKATWLESIGRNARERETRKTHHAKASGFTHAPNLLIATFANRELDPRLVALVADQRCLGRLRLAIFKHDTLRPMFNVTLLHDTGNLHDVALGNFAFRMEKSVRKLTIVGYQYDAACAEIEASHRENASADRLQVVAHGGTAFRIRHRAYDAARLVKHVIDRLLGDDASAVEVNAITSRDLGSELFDGLAVNANATRFDERFA